MIFITEGDSATGTMVNARDVSYQAIFSLRGKPENMFGKRKTALFENEELKNLTFSLGVQKDVADLRYDKIVIATDADNDGYHIRNLVMTYLLLYFEELVLSGPTGAGAAAVTGACVSSAGKCIERIINTKEN